MRLIAVLMLGTGFGTLVACGGGTSGSSSSSSSSSCVSNHECINGVCECTNAGMSGTSCQEDSCEATCEVCDS